MDGPNPASVRDSSEIITGTYLTNENIAKLASVSDFFACQDPSTFIEAEYATDIATMSAVTPFPPEVAIHYSCAKNSAFFGALPSISRFYAAIDNKVFMWKTSGGKVIEQIEEDCLAITSVGVFDSNRFCLPKEIEHCVAIATPGFIKVYPFIEGGLLPDRFFVCKTSFVTLSMAKGPAGSVICGTEKGDIHAAFLDAAHSRVSVTKCNLFSIRKALLNSIQYPSSPVKHISSSFSGEYVCTVDVTGYAQFYKIDPLSLRARHLGSAFDKLNPIVCTSCTDAYLNGAPTFITFHTDGSRRVYAVQSKHLVSHKYEVLKTIPSPVESKTQLVSACCLQGFTSMVFENECLFMRSQGQDIEMVAKYELPGKAISTSGWSFFYPCSPFSHNNANIWEIHDQIPSILILSTAGGQEIRPVMPCETLKRVIVESHEESGQSTPEHIRSCILMSTLYPDHRRWFIYDIIRASKDSDCFIPGIYSGVAALVGEFWGVPVLTETKKVSNGEMKWKVNQAFFELPTGLVTRLQDFVTLAKEVIDTERSVLSIYDTKAQDLLQTKELQVTILSSFVGLLIECLRFICTIGQQKSAVITQIIKELEEDNKHIIQRLTVDPFGDSKVSNTELVTALRVFSSTFFRLCEPGPRADRLATQLGMECPLIVNSAVSQLSNAILELTVAEFLPSDSVGEVLPRLVNSILELSEENLPLEDICRKLINLEDPRSAIRVCIARAKAIDKYGQALRWYEAGCNKADFVGNRVFNSVISCFEPLLDLLDDPKTAKMCTSFGYKLLQYWAENQMKNKIN